MNKSHDVFFGVVLTMFVCFIVFLLSIVYFEQEEAKKREIANAAYEQLDAKGGIARFPELAAVDMEDFGGQYTDKDLVNSYRTKKHILIDPVTGDLFVAIRTYATSAGIFRISTEGEILQEYSHEEFYQLGVVDRLVK